LTLVLLLFSIGLITLGGVTLLRAWKPRTYTVNMLTDLVPNRRLLAQKMAEQARRYGLNVVLSAKEYGALDALALVDEPNPIDLAFVPAGVLGRPYPNVRQITALMREPLHLLVRSDLAEGGIAGLRGKRINLGPRSSATHWVSRDVLAFAGLHINDDGKWND
jgi:hypothetical protein